MRLTNPKHGNVRSMRLPLSNQAEIYQRLAKYEDTGLEPKQIEALQQENEQLQAQNGAMVEALKQAREALISVSYRSGLGSDEDGIREAIAAIDKEVGE